MPAIPTFVSLLHGLISVSLAAEPSGVPSRTIPGSVLVELQSLENRFELALAQDCAVDQCYSNGCAYVDHAVADQPQHFVASLVAHGVVDLLEPVEVEH